MKGSQKPGIDYNETNSPVVRYTSLRYLISVAAHFDLDIEQIDAVTEFLLGYLSEEIYMEHPERMGDQAIDNVCKLNKSIYGLKQASRELNKN